MALTKISSMQKIFHVILSHDDEGQATTIPCENLTDKKELEERRNSIENCLLLPTSQNELQIKSFTTVLLLPVDQRSDSNDSSSRLTVLWERSRGFVFAITSGLLLTVYSFLFKKTSGSVVMPTVLLCRGVLECLTLGTVALCKREPPMNKKNNNNNDDNSDNKSTTFLVLLMLCVATMGGFRALFIFFGLQLLDMSAVHVVLNAAPVVVTAMSACCLGERINRFSIVACLLMLTGIGCIFGPSIAENGMGGGKKGSLSTELLGLSFAVVALLFNSLVTVFGKKVNPHFTQHWITSYNGAAIVATALVAYPVDAAVQVLVRGFKEDNDNNNATMMEEDDVAFSASLLPQDGFMWGLVMGTAVAGMLQQFTFFCALHYESAPRTTMVRSVQMIFSWMVEVSLGHEVRLLTIFGMFVILFAIFVITVEKERKSLKSFCGGGKTSIVNSFLKKKRKRNAEEEEAEVSS